MLLVPLSGKWLQPYKTADEREKFKQVLISDRLVLERLYAIIEEFESELDQNEFSISEYDHAAWPYLKADRIGERRGLHKIKQLLSFLNE
jgi:hypothetical protein